MCVWVWVCAHGFSALGRQQNWVGSHSAGATGSDELPVGAGNWSLVICKSSACSELRSHLSSPRRHWLKHLDIPKLEWLWPLSAPARFTALLAIKTPEYSGSTGWGSHTWPLQEHGWFCQGYSSLHCWTKTRHLKSNLSLVFFSPKVLILNPALLKQT